MQRTPLTLHAIFERFRTVFFEGKVVDADGVRTYGEVADRVRRLCAVLTEELGVQPGDRVASYAWNSSRHLELYFAVPLVGAVLHTVNVRLHPSQVEYVVGHAGDEVLFVDESLEGQLVGAELPRLRRRVMLGDEYESLVAAAAPIEPAKVDEHAACGLCYTSGTTGMPKGVLSSHRGMFLHSLATLAADAIGIREADRVLPIVPMFHAFGWGLPYSAPLAGAELVFHGRDSSPENLARVIGEHRPTVAAAVPTIWKELLPLLRSGEVDYSSLRLVFVGGSASPRALIEAYEDLGIEYLQVWGMTETGPLACTSRPRRRHRGLTRDRLLDVKERTGTIMAGLEARVTVDGRAAEPGEVGELEVRGPWVASGYYEEPDAERFDDGWLRTGDMASMDADGYFRIVDRAKDLVKSGGEWISSVELEGQLLAHPGVRDAAVVGVPSRKWDERPVAVLVPRDPDAPPTLESVREFLAGRVAKWWLPDEVVLVEEIPKTSVGKLDKKTIRAQLADLELP